MKINNIHLLTLVNILLLVALTRSSAPDPNPTHNPKFDKAIKTQHDALKMEKNTLKKPIRLYRTRQEKKLTVRIKYVYESPINNDPKSPQNLFDYKLFQINDEHMVIYRVDQSETQFNEINVNSSFYLMTVKLENIDLICMDHYWLCTLGQFKREYRKKLKNMNFTTNKKVLESLEESIADTNCIVFTVGVFKSLGEVGYMCFEEREDTVFFLDLISERILARYRTDYEGQLRLVNQVSLKVNKLEFSKCALHARLARWSIIT